MQALTENAILIADSYKYSHHLQIPPNTTNDFSYLEARGGPFQQTVFFGLQYYLQKYLSRPITMVDVEQAEQIITAHMGPGIFNRKGFQYIVENHGGYWPVRIQAVPEGTPVPIKNVLMTIEATDPQDRMAVLALVRDGLRHDWMVNVASLCSWR